MPRRHTHIIVPSSIICCYAPKVRPSSACVLAVHVQDDCPRTRVEWQTSTSHKRQKAPHPKHKPEQVPWCLGGACPAVLPYSVCVSVFSRQQRRELRSDNCIHTCMHPSPCPVFGLWR